jgi:DNA-binding transcriptional ArsR family regulator
VESRKEGRWMYYRLAEQSNPATMGKMLTLLFEEMEQTPQMVADEKKLKRICSETLDSLCRRLFCKPGKC